MKGRNMIRTLHCQQQHQSSYFLSLCVFSNLNSAPSCALSLYCTFTRTCLQTFQTPRVNGAVLEQFVGQTVCIVGKIVSHEEGAPESQIETSVRLEPSLQFRRTSKYDTFFVCGFTCAMRHGDLTVQTKPSTRSRHLFVPPVRTCMPTSDGEVKGLAFALFHLPFHL